MAHKRIHDMSEDDQVDFYCEMIYQWVKKHREPYEGPICLESGYNLEHYDFDLLPYRGREADEMADPMINGWDIRKVLDRIF